MRTCLSEMLWAQLLPMFQGWGALKLAALPVMAIFPLTALLHNAVPSTIPECNITVRQPTYQVVVV